MRWVLVILMLLAGIGSMGIGLDTVENSYVSTKNHSDEIFKAHAWAALSGVFFALAIMLAVGP